MKRTSVVAMVLLAALILLAQGKREAITAALPQEPLRFDVCESGTLKAVRDKQGKEIFGSNRPPNEGYVVGYQLVDRLRLRLTKSTGNNSLI